MEGLTFRQDYFSDVAALAALADLLRDTFGIDISVQNRFGGPDPSSMSFGYFDESGRCVANISAFTMPMMIGGKAFKAAGYQSGAVRPEYRGRGLYRSLLNASFAWSAAAGHEAGFLLTDKPALYEPFGFQTVQQTKYVGSVPEIGGSAQEAREIRIDNPAEVEPLRSLLKIREPVSARFSVQRQAEMFLLNAWFDRDIRLTFLEQIEALIAWKKGDDGNMVLLDIVAPNIPTLPVILEHLPHRISRIEVRFPTDKLNWPARPRPYQGACSLMVSGLTQGELLNGIMLSPMAEF